ncbi:helix-turn-helix domain-containing protein [Parapedobacter deserti]|uniref:Helix-turn-helix domain-containing protein n=1 Tax=Parapedobacter deserti TaxID=1912957 RepID=A0ABV7JN47_9SPHI
MTFGQRLITLRKAKKLSQGDLGREVGTSGDIIGRYERDEVTPSVEVASRLADALGVSLDYLSGKTDTELDNAALSRIRDITVMPEEDRKQVFLVIDALIRDFKARKAYAQ